MTRRGPDGAGGADEIPARFLTFSERHQLDSRYTWWGSSALLGGFGLFIGALLASSGDFGLPFWLTAVPGAILALSALPLRSRYMRRSAHNREAYERWTSEQPDE